MAQTVTAVLNGKTQTLCLPDCNQEVLPGVKWGHHYATFTPSFWASLAWLNQIDCYSDHRIGDSLAEEISACLLGGYGIPAEVGLAAFYRLRDSGLLKGKPPTDALLGEVLSKPLSVQGRQVRYRFAPQRSRYVSAALFKLSDIEPPINDELTFRQWLLEFEGIGPKTASWITRNWLNSEKVAIIDIHIHRAGLLMGLFNSGDSPAKHYFDMEKKFLAFAAEISVRPSQLDALIWRQMKDAGSMIFKLLK